MNEFIYLVQQFPLYIIVLIRTAGVLGMAPIFKQRAIPMPVKVALSAMVAFVILPGIPRDVLGGFIIPDTILGWSFLVGREMLIGITMGFLAGLIMTGPMAAGEFAARDMGLAVASDFNAELQTTTTPATDLFIVAFSLMMLVLNVHHWFIQALVKTYSVVPIGGFNPSTEILYMFVELMSWIYVIGVKIAAPIMAVLFLFTTAIGIMSRAAPQVNILMISFPIKLAVGLTIMALSFHTISRNFEKILFKLHTDLEVVTNLMGGA